VWANARLIARLRNAIDRRSETDTAAQQGVRLMI
jgi:hypothetical protein